MSKRTVFAVDDDRLVTRLIQVNLERAGYAVKIAFNGIEALETLRSEPQKPDLILLDVTMPYMDGFEMLSRMQEDPALKPIPVVMVTARALDADIAHGHEKGALHYIAKPINPTELLRTVRAVLGEGEDTNAAETRPV